MHLVMPAATEPMIWGMTRGEFAVAAGTLALALFTALLAGVTWRDVKDTHRLAETARLAYEARYEPYLVAVLESASLKGGVASDVSFRLWNLGAGPALKVKVCVVVRDGGLFGARDRVLEVQLINVGDAVLIRGNMAHLGATDPTNLMICGDYFDRVEVPKMIPSDEWLYRWMPTEYENRVAIRRAFDEKSSGGESRHTAKRH